MLLAVGQAWLVVAAIVQAPTAPQTATGAQLFPAAPFVDDGFKWRIGYYATAFSFDIASTEYAVRSGAREANPIPLFRSRAGRITGSLALSGLCAALDQDLSRRGHRQLARRLRLTFFLSRAALVAWNLRAADRLPPGPR